jgi:hypothetical protein
MSEKAVYLEVMVPVRFWEDSRVDGIEDVNGLIHGRDGSVWRIHIHMDTGYVVQWPKGVDAEIGYKVCDEGIYKILNHDLDVLLKRDGQYVPDFLSIGDEGFGDYVYLDIDRNGMIRNWVKPVVYHGCDGWEAVGDKS